MDTAHNTQRSSCIFFRKRLYRYGSICYIDTSDYIFTSIMNPMMKTKDYNPLQIMQRAWSEYCTVFRLLEQITLIRSEHDNEFPLVTINNMVYA